MGKFFNHLQMALLLNKLQLGYVYRHYCFKFKFH